MTKTTGHCPHCTAPHRLLGKGQMARHGFSAHFPYGSGHGGFHSSSCAGSGRLPIGTESGNATALQNASLAESRAEMLRCAPAPTLADCQAAFLADLAAPRSFHEGEFSRRSRLAKLEAFKAAFAAGDMTALAPRGSGWYERLESLLAKTAKRLVTERGAQEAGLRALAAELRRLVAAT